MEINDVVQITNRDHHWFPCLVIVTEIKHWGVQGYILVPKDNRGNISQAFIRLKSEDIERIGPALIVDREKAAHD